MTQEDVRKLLDQKENYETFRDAWCWCNREAAKDLAKRMNPEVDFDYGWQYTTIFASSFDEAIDQFVILVSETY